MSEERIEEKDPSDPRVIVGRIRQWVLNYSTADKLPRGQILLWEVSHILDGLPLPKLTDAGRKATEERQ